MSFLINLISLSLSLSLSLSYLRINIYDFTLGMYFLYFK